MTGNCDRCGRSFTAATKRARFCSDSCRAQASRARRDGRPERIGVAAVVELNGQRTAVGAVRRDLEAWLTSRELSGHPLAAAALALADRIDGDSDALSGLAIAVGRLQAVLDELDGRTAQRAPDVLDMLRLRALAKMAGYDLSDALDADAMHAITVEAERRSS